MAPLLAWIAAFFAHNLNRFIGVVLIGIVLIGGPVLIYRNVYNKGFHAGYARCLIEHPPVTVTGGTTTFNQSSSNGSFFIFLKIGKFKLLAI